MTFDIVREFGQIIKFKDSIDFWFISRKSSAIGRGQRVPDRSYHKRCEFWSDCVETNH